MTERITTPFDAESTAAEVIAGIDLTGRRTVVTGGASGIGVETARALASAGAEVTLTKPNSTDCVPRQGQRPRSGRPRSTAQRRRFSLQRRRCSTASVAAISKTATKPRSAS
jgi:NAD(P)-dependent dehydrogenase (short-subunit alcohol dehydrogenase family)